MSKAIDLSLVIIVIIAGVLMWIDHDNMQRQFEDAKAEIQFTFAQAKKGARFTARDGMCLCLVTAPREFCEAHMPHGGDDDAEIDCAVFGAAQGFDANESGALENCSGCH